MDMGRCCDSQLRLLEFQRRFSNQNYEAAAEQDIDQALQSTPTAGVVQHQLMLEELSPLFATSMRYEILTVGDGRGGLEARFLKSFGHKVVASDLCTQRLEKIAQHGYIDAYRELNAESLDVPDNAFDLVFAKEVLHHLQRPYLAVYEMLRVARCGIMILEPHYRYPSSVVACLRQIVRRLLRREGSSPLALLPRVHYEESGNFLFRFNPYELVQCALAMGITDVAFRYCHRIIDPRNRHLQREAMMRWLRKHRRKMARNDAFKGEQHRALLCFAVFKAGIDQDWQDRLSAAKFHIPQLKPNPMLRQAA